MAARLTTYVVVAIVAATLIAGLIVGAQRDDSSGPVDLIVHNAKVYTADALGSMAEALAVRGNQILRVGTEREIMRLRRPQTTIIDARGATVLPGFNDAHVHFIEGGLALDEANLLGASGLEDLLGRVSVWATAHPERGWVLGRGWSYDQLGNRTPARQQLDAIVRDRPAALLSADGRSLWVNSRALKAAGVTGRTPNPAGGAIVRDARTGEPTGLLHEAATTLVSRAAPAPTREDRARALRAAIDAAHAYGITSVQIAGGRPDDLALFDDARRAGELSMRVYEAIAVTPPFDAAEADRLEALWKKYPDDPLLKSGAIEIPLGAGEAASGTRGRQDASAADGLASLTPAALDRIVQAMDRRGWQVITHAVGDSAVRMTLDAYARASELDALPARGRRHRLGLVDDLAPEDAPRFAGLGIVLSPAALLASPRAADPDTPAGPSVRGVPQPAIAETLLKARAHLAFGSDWPRAPLDPLLTLAAAADAETGPSTDAGFAPRLKSAIDAATAGGAWASFDEHRKGTLAPGMLADIIVLSDDIFAESPAQLASTTVDVTIFDGKVVYRRKPSRAGTSGGVSPRQPANRVPPPPRQVS